MGLGAGAVGGLGNAVRTGRASTGSLAGGASASIAVPFPVAFADTNYTASATVAEGTAGDSLRVLKILSQTAGSVTVLVINQDTLNARTGAVHVLAIHD